MASAITHFIVGAALALPARLNRVLPRWAMPVTGGLVAAAPDLDTPLMFALDIPRGSLFAHRGFFHSPFFLALSCSLVARIVARRAWLPLAALWTACAITHPLLDMLTNGGSGVMLLFPVSEARLFFPWRPIRVSPLGIVRFFEPGRPDPTVGSAVRCRRGHARLFDPLGLQTLKNSARLIPCGTRFASVFAGSIPVGFHAALREGRRPATIRPRVGGGKLLCRQPGRGRAVARS